MSTFIEQEQQYNDDYDDEPRFQKRITCRTVFCSKIVKGVLVALVIAIICPLLAYHLAISRSITQDEDELSYSCLVQQEYRISCGPVGISAEDCVNIFCCFNETTEQCHHYLPSKYYYETANSETEYLYTFTKIVKHASVDIITDLRFTKSEEGQKLSLVLEDANQVSSLASGVSNGELNNFKITYSNSKLILDVRDKDNDVIFNTANGALIASKYFWEWSFQFSNHTLFGLGQNVIRLAGNETIKKVIYKNRNDHSTQPVIWTYNKNKFYGFLVKNNGPVEITVLPSNIVIVRSLTSNRFEVEITQGSTPKDLYENQIGNFVPSPLWALGTHNCRKGDETELADILEIYADVSFDSECIHENLYLSLQKGTSSDNDTQNLRSILNNIRSSGTKFVLSLQPHVVAFDNNTLYNESKDIFYKDSSGDIYQGSYLGLPVAYPDYTHKNIKGFAENLIKWIHEKLGEKTISGFVLSENWLQDDSVDEVYNSSFKYYPENINIQMQYTIPWNLSTSDDRHDVHMEIHNSYGSLQYNTLKAVDVSTISATEDISDFFIASASKTFGDNEPEISDNFNTSWDYFKMYLDKILFSSITGDYMVGLPICGDTDTYNKILHESLCIRWYEAAATMPYFRVSSGDPYRDPSNLNTNYSTDLVRKIIERRKMLQYYYYTIITTSLPLVRPLYFDYFNDTATFFLEGQYAIGSDIIVAHPLTSGRWRLQVYLPPEREVWYELWGGTMFIPEKKNKYIVEIDIIETDWVSFIAQGTIVALVDDNIFNFYIASNCLNSSNCTANGELMKDGTRLSFKLNERNLTINDLPSNCEYSMGYVNYYRYIGSTGYKEHKNATNDKFCKNNNTSYTLMLNDLDEI